jgi:hypothetical protein
MCCEKIKQELEKTLAELSSAQLMIHLLQKEGSANGEVGHGSSEFRNVIQIEKLDSKGTKENN